MLNGENKTFQNRREYSRVNAYIPLEFRLVSPQERDKVRSRISGETVLSEFEPLPDTRDESLHESLKILHAKLDTIIRMMTSQHEGFYSLPFRLINISGSGMTFSSEKPFSEGDVLEIKMVFSKFRPVALYVYGEVVKVERQADEYNTAVRFILLDDLIRDEIIGFVFEREREILREKRG